MKQANLEQRTAQQVPKRHIQCNAGYDGCLRIVPKKEARCIEGTGLSCENCYGQYLHTQD